MSATDPYRSILGPLKVTVTDWFSAARPRFSGVCGPAGKYDHTVRRPARWRAPVRDGAWPDSSTGCWLKRDHRKSGISAPTRLKCLQRSRQVPSRPVLFPSLLYYRFHRRADEPPKDLANRDECVANFDRGRGAGPVDISYISRVTGPWARSGGFDQVGAGTSSHEGDLARPVSGREPDLPELTRSSTIRMSVASLS